MWVSTNNFISPGSRPRVVACKKKKLLVKYFYIKLQFKKMDAIKKESYHPLRIQNKHNGFIGARGNWTINHFIPVFSTELWLPYETLGHHVLDIIY